MRSEFYDKRWQFKKQDTIKIATVLNGELYKGFDTILRTSNILKSIGLSFEWNIFGINDGFSAQKTIENNVQTKFSNNNIHFRGKKNANELVHALLDSTFYIHTSHIDNSSNAICEAMILGVPTIATHVGGTPSLIENNVNGFLVSDSEPFQIAYIIKTYWNNKDKLEQISSNSSITAQRRHNKKDILFKISEIYNDIIMDFYNKLDKNNNENYNK